MADNGLVIKNVSFSYEKGRQVLSDIDLCAGDGESVGITGANGAGKSTLLKIMAGLERASCGSVRVCGTLLETKNLSEVRKNIGYVFQDPDSQLFMPTVYEDVAFAPRSSGLSEDKAWERAMAALERVGIKDLADRHTYKLSGGEKKLASIACALSMDPGILLMDEPTASLDPRNRRRIIELLNSLPQTKLITSHDLDFILDTCGRTVLLSGGVIVKDGPTEDILTDGPLLEANGLELPLSLQKRG